MAKFAIKKRISLGFLGKDYDEAYLIFRSIPLNDFEGILDDISKAEDDKDPKASLKLMFNALQNYFHSGEFPDDEGKLQTVTKEDLIEFIDNETAVKCFELLTGQNIDPKDEPPSTNISTTEPDSA